MLPDRVKPAPAVTDEASAMATDCLSSVGQTAGRAGAQASEAPRALTRLYLASRTALDWAAALALLTLSAPLMAALVALVRGTSTGPAFYTQVRLGRAGRAFRVWKLRTMTHRCEEATGPV